MRAPRACADDRLSTISRPGARRGDEAARRRAHRPRGRFRVVVRLPREHAHRVEPGPDVVRRPFGAAGEHPHARGPPAPCGTPRRPPRCRWCTRCCWSSPGRRAPASRRRRRSPSSPSSARPTVLPIRRTLPSFTFGTTHSPTVSTPPMPVPMIAPVSQSTSSEPGSGTVKPGVAPAVDRRDARVDHAAVQRPQRLLREVLLLQLLADLRHPADLAAEPEVAQLLVEADARSPLAQRLLERLEAVRVGRDDPHARDHDPFSHCEPPIPTPSSAPPACRRRRTSATRQRSLCRRQNTRSPRIVTVSPGSTDRRNSDSASTNSVVHCARLVDRVVEREQVDAERHHADLAHRLEQDHARRDRPPGEVARVEPLVLPERVAPDDVLPRRPRRSRPRSGTAAAAGGDRGSRSGVSCMRRVAVISSVSSPGSSFAVRRLTSP